MTHLEGMKYCLELIDKLKCKYISCGYLDHDLPIDKVIDHISNEIGARCYRDWPRRT